MRPRDSRHAGARRSVWGRLRIGRGAALFAALLLLLASFLMPRITLRRPVYDVLAVADITGSMNARDGAVDGQPATRLAMEKAALQDLARRLPCGSLMGLAVFAEERPFVLIDPVEVCENAEPLQRAIGGVAWMMGWDSESHIAGGVRAAMQAAASRGADLVFMTDGQEMPPLAWSAPVDFAPVRGRAAGLLVGVGGEAFVPIPKFDRLGREIGVWRPGELPSETGGLFKGHEYLTAVDSPHLRALAVATGLVYQHLGGDGVFAALRAAVSRRTEPVMSDVRWIAGALALLCLALACVPEFVVVSVRRFAGARK